MNNVFGIPYFRETIAAIDRVMNTHGVPYFLVGATAINLLLQAKGERPVRATRDIDFAISIGRIEQYDILLSVLENEEIYEYHNDLFADNDLTLREISVRVLGRKSAIILNGYDPLRDRMNLLLSEEFHSGEPGKIAFHWANLSDQPIEYGQDLLRSYRDGLLENSPSR